MMQQKERSGLRVAVIGAGVIGASTALELAQDGHEVIVIDRNAAAAEGASHANAGLISPGHCYSWAEPGALRAAIGALLGRGDGIGVCDPWRPSLWRWAFLFACETALPRWRENSRAAIALATLSRDLLFRADHPVSPQHWEGRQAGIYYLHSGSRNADEAELLQTSGEPYVQLNRSQTLEQYAFFRASAIAFDHATFCPADGTGNAARFTDEALRQATKLGAEVRYRTEVVGFGMRARSVRAVRTRSGEIEVDAVVIAAGLQSRELFRLLGHRLPLYPVTGYSITYRGVDALPSSGGVSLSHKIAWAPLEDSSLRLTGFADIGVPRDDVAARRFAALDKFAQRLHPQLKNCQGVRWVGQRPMTPDGLPFLGRSAVSNVYANCGHGAMGWTLSTASAHVTGRLLRGRAAEIDLTPYAVDRYGMSARRK